MSLTLLLDLDNTLLANDIDTFLPAYLRAFSEYVSPHIEPEKFVRALMAGTRRMVDNQQPDCTLEEVFRSLFFPTTGMDKDEFESLADQFYARIFPSLQELTNPIPEAIQFVEMAGERGYRLVIATNPLFPRTAILQRLAWAGLPIEKNNFDLVASLETFHFAKPNPAFFAETLGRIGWPEGPVVVVGDDLERDIAPAEQLGLTTYWIDHQDSEPGSASENPAMSGDMGYLMPWLESMSDDDLIPEYNSISALLAVLRSTPAVLDSLCRDVSEGTWTKRPSASEWCPTEILCHLRDVEQEVNLPRLRKVLGEEDPFLPGEDTDPWAEEREYICQDGKQALHSFMVERMRLLDILTKLPDKSWQRSARHAIFGRTHLKELVGIIAGHDRMHIRQFYRDLGSNQA